MKGRLRPHLCKHVLLDFQICIAPVVLVSYRKQVVCGSTSMVAAECYALYDALPLCVCRVLHSCKCHDSFT